MTEPPIHLLDETSAITLEAMRKESPATIQPSTASAQ